ncbi:MAG TPA: 50S ribosomal protein L11 methyltransferase [Steroidobacteraceae bacterium]|nr:50S ribosomal protein L11 methyltransferase [Steroidobacteraceae bacterium]
MAAYLELSFELGSLDPQLAEDSGFACGAGAVTFVDAREEPVCHPTRSGPTLEAGSVLEPAPGEFRLWRQTRVKCLFTAQPAHAGLISTLAASLGIDATLISARQIADRAWEREWLKDFHAMRFGRRLWVCPSHERVSAPSTVVVQLDPGLAFGTGTHASTALCLTWLDAHLAPGTRVIDYGCGSGVLAIAAARLGAAEVHGFDIDPQALMATRDNAGANGVEGRVRVHADPATLPAGVDVLLANILAGPLCELAPRFAALVRPRGELVLAGLMEAEAADVTDAYGACFDVARAGDRDGWVCLAGRRY